MKNNENTKINKTIKNVVGLVIMKIPCLIPITEINRIQWRNNDSPFLMLFSVCPARI